MIEKSTQMTTKKNSYIAARQTRCRALLTENKLDALIVTDPVDVRYLTGFTGDDSVLVFTRRRKVLVTDSRFVEQLRHDCYRLPLFTRNGPMPEAVGQVLTHALPGKRRKRIGIDPHTVTVKEHGAYRRQIGKSLVYAESLVPGLRLCKDADEVKHITRAIRVAEDAMRRTIGRIKAGMTEQQVAARLDYEMAQRGSTAPAFPTIVAFGPHAAQPHAVPGNTRLRSNQPILVDWGATINGYRSDLTRCYVIGKIPLRFAREYQRVLDAQLAAIEAVSPGAAMKDPDSRARRTLGKTAGMYRHGTGHGLGMKVHEPPVLGPHRNEPLRQGMIVTVEPGVYLPGKFGIRIEDDVLVTANGRRVLSRLEKDLHSVLL